MFITFTWLVAIFAKKFKIADIFRFGKLWKYLEFFRLKILKALEIWLIASFLCNLRPLPFNFNNYKKYTWGLIQKQHNFW